jgi:hypothetical protein
MGVATAASSGQENYIRSLQQQIKILELEIAYLKKLPPKEGDYVHACAEAPC